MFRLKKGTHYLVKWFSLGEEKKNRILEKGKFKGKSKYSSE